MVSDPSYGRYLGPHHPKEKELELRPDLTIHRRRVFLDKDGNGVGKGHGVKLVPEELEVPQEWIYYKSWEIGTAASSSSTTDFPGRGTDVVIVHGLSDYSGRWAVNVVKLLEAGFRVWVFDMATHGRSSGIHCHIMDEAQLPKSLEAALVAIAEEDIRNGGEQRKTLLVGHSLGGWTMFAHSVTYPATPTPPPSTSPAPLRSHISGIYALAPFLGIAPESQPSPIIVLAGRLIRLIKPDFPIEEGVVGKQSDHPETDEEFRSDPQTYHGKIRCSTGLSLLRMTPYIQSPASALIVSALSFPVRLVHGKQDRVCAAQGSVDFVAKMTAGTGKKECEIWEGYEHAMLAYGYNGLDEEHEKKRLHLLDDMLNWAIEQAKAT